METDIIVSGFNAAEDMHGVRYMRVIGDGDSSVMCSMYQYEAIWSQKLNVQIMPSSAIGIGLKKSFKTSQNTRGKGN